MTQHLIFNQKIKSMDLNGWKPHENGWIPHKTGLMLHDN